MHEGRNRIHTPDSVKSYLTLDDIWACVPGKLGLTLRLCEKCGFVDFQNSVPEGTDSFIHTVYFVTFKLFRVDCEQNIDMKVNFLV
jgi:hypothetical protein